MQGLGVTQSWRCQSSGQSVQRRDPSPTPGASLPPARRGGGGLVLQAELQQKRVAISSAVTVATGAPGVGTERRWIALSGAR